MVARPTGPLWPDERIAAVAARVFVNDTAKTDTVPVGRLYCTVYVRGRFRFRCATSPDERETRIDSRRKWFYVENWTETEKTASFSTRQYIYI